MQSSSPRGETPCSPCSRSAHFSPPCSCSVWSPGLELLPSGSASRPLHLAESRAGFSDLIVEHRGIGALRGDLTQLAAVQSKRQRVVVVNIGEKAAGRRQGDPVEVLGARRAAGDAQKLLIERRPER